MVHDLGKEREGGQVGEGGEEVEEEEGEEEEEVPETVVWIYYRREQIKGKKRKTKSSPKGLGEFAPLRKNHLMAENCSHHQSVDTSLFKLSRPVKTYIT